MIYEFLKLSTFILIIIFYRSQHFII